RALADGAGHPLDRPGADVAGDEDPGDARLEGPRLAGEGPAGGLGVGTGEDEAPGVAGDDAVEPVGPGDGPDEDEAGVGLDRGLGAVGVAHPEGAEASVALGGDGDAPGPD